MFELLKSGVSSKGKVWATGTVKWNGLEINGIFTIENTDKPLVDTKIQFKNLKMKNSNGKIYFTIEL